MVISLALLFVKTVSPPPTTPAIAVNVPLVDGVNATVIGEADAPGAMGNPAPRQMMRPGS